MNKFLFRPVRFLPKSFLAVFLSILLLTSLGARLNSCAGCSAVRATHRVYVGRPTGHRHL